MGKISEIITDTILRHERMTLTELESRATKRGLSLSDLYSALEVVHRDKRITRSVSKGEVVYSKRTPKPPPNTSHLTWYRTNYPSPDPWCLDEHGKMIDPFPEIDLSYMFLKTKDERDAFRAEMTGRPRYTKQTWQRKSHQSS